MLKEIPNFEGYYVSDSGQVYSSKTEKYLKPFKNNRNRLTVRLCKDGRVFPLLVHRLMALAFLDLPSLDSDLEVDHKDTDCTNNTLSNLQVLTSEQHKLKTYGAKPLCTQCSQEVPRYNTSGICTACKEESRLKDGITEDSIVYWVTKYSWVRASKELGMTDSGLRKRYTKLSGLPAKDIKNRC